MANCSPERHALLTVLLSILFFCLGIVKADGTPQNHFINPPVPEQNHYYADDNLYAIGSEINFQWITNYSSITLIMYQNNNDTPQVINEIYGVDTVQSVQWQVNLTGLFPLSTSASVFFMQLYDATTMESDDPSYFSSHYFNITDNSASATTTSSSSTTSATATSTTSPSPSSSSSSSSSGGLSSGAKAGIGVGVSLGVIALLAAGAAIAFFMRRRKRAASGSRPTGDGVTMFSSSGAGTATTPMYGDNASTSMSQSQWSAYPQHDNNMMPGSHNQNQEYYRPYHLSLDEFGFAKDGGRQQTRPELDGADNGVNEIMSSDVSELPSSEQTLGKDGGSKMTWEEKEKKLAGDANL